MAKEKEAAGAAALDADASALAEEGTEEAREAREDLFGGSVVGLPAHAVDDSAKVLIVQVLELRDCRGADGYIIDP